MSSIRVIDRLSGQPFEEEVYGGWALRALYGKGFFSRALGGPVRALLCRLPFFSALYGAWQRLSFTRSKVQPFIRKYGIDATEFDAPVGSFANFDAFFTRKLKSGARPIAPGDDVAIIPADGRYLFYPDLTAADGFVVKGKKFTLESLLQDAHLAQRYTNGTMILARLCPTDYHRFHFPCDGRASSPHSINGWWYSVNPIALRRNVKIFCENKRSYTLVESENFGQVLYMEVGATNVGSIHQTYTPQSDVKKGDEKGYFSFGASSLVLLFEKDRIRLDEDLIRLSTGHQEVRCLMGQSMGQSIRNEQR